MSLQKHHLYNYIKQKLECESIFTEVCIINVVIMRL